MMMKLMQAAVLVAAGLTLGGCPMSGTQTAAPAKKPPAADYQEALPPAPAGGTVRANCYNADDLATIRARMTHQELTVATLQCQNASGARAYDNEYRSFLAKYQADLSTNARALQGVASRHRLNIDVLVTEFANRTAQKAPVDREFCTRTIRAFEWALHPNTASLNQVPPPYDLGPDMNIHACPAR
jgi:hypothetical protein